MNSRPVHSSAHPSFPVGEKAGRSTGTYTGPAWNPRQNTDARYHDAWIYIDAFLLVHLDISLDDTFVLLSMQDEALKWPHLPFPVLQSARPDYSSQL